MMTITIHNLSYDKSRLLLAFLSELAEAPNA